MDRSRSASDDRGGNRLDTDSGADTDGAISHGGAPDSAEAVANGADRRTVGRHTDEDTIAGAPDDENVVRVGTHGSLADTAAESVGTAPLNARPSATNDRSPNASEVVGRGHRVSTAHADDAAAVTVSEEDLIEIPVSGEDVAVRKRVRLAEEVEVGKETVQRTEQVAATVRHERVHVEGRTLDASERHDGDGRRGAS